MQMLLFYFLILKSHFYSYLLCDSMIIYSLFFFVYHLQFKIFEKLFTAFNNHALCNISFDAIN